MHITPPASGFDTLRTGDNFIYALYADDNACIIDPGEAAPVISWLQDTGRHLSRILLTHYHGDHTAGCAALRRATGCRVAGPAGGRVPLDETLEEGMVVMLGDVAIHVLAVPGHTHCDTAYYVSEVHAVFTGDVLFAGGCGRVFAGHYGQMWLSLQRLRALPPETRVCGGHDYLLDNLAFAAHLEPGNREVASRLSDATSSGNTASPSSLAVERQTNPFLRCDDPLLMESVAPHTTRPAEVFAALRHQKDQW